jgi:ferredoxin
MPWVDRNICIGCGTCVEECPVGTIVMEDDVAEIHMDKCIHCGKCHDVCEQEAVRHDSEKRAGRTEQNVEETKCFMEACEKYLGDAEERQKCLNRMIKHFNNEKIIAENTLQEIELLRE